jgi:hypothetical protein
MTIKVIDGFLNDSYHKEILNLLNGPSFPWYYQNNLTYVDQKGALNDFGFSHLFVNEDGPKSSYYNLILPFILKVKDEIKAKKVIRCRGDMTVLSLKKYVHQYHTDFNFPNIASVYYVNDSDGETIFKESKKSIKPKANRLIIFERIKRRNKWS